MAVLIRLCWKHAGSRHLLSVQVAEMKPAIHGDDGDVLSVGSQGQALRLGIERPCLQLVAAAEALQQSPVEPAEFRRDATDEAPGLAEIVVLAGRLRLRQHSGITGAALCGGTGEGALRILCSAPFILRRPPPLPRHCRRATEDGQQERAA